MMTDPLQILLTTGGLLICFFLGYWFNKVNKSQENTDKELRDVFVSQREAEMESKKQNSELREARKRNENLSIEFKKESLILVQEMKVMSRSISTLYQTTSIHSVKLENLAEQNRIISDQLRNNQAS